MCSIIKSVSSEVIKSKPVSLLGFERVINPVLVISGGGGRGYALQPAVIIFFILYQPITEASSLYTVGNYVKTHASCAELKKYNLQHETSN